MTADQIRAEIFRLQQMLEQVEGAAQTPNYNDPDYNRWLESMGRSSFKTMNKWDYYELDKSRQLVFNPELAREREYQGWVKRREETKRRQQQLQEKAREKAIAEEQSRRPPLPRPQPPFAPTPRQTMPPAWS